eukprot:2751386-Pleurochrysis_carterae.AAC.1
MDQSMMPSGLRFAAARMASFSRNCFRVEPSSNSTARASSVITFNFPEGSTLDLRSLCFYCKASGQENAVATSRFPRHAPGSLIQRIELL